MDYNTKDIDFGRAAMLLGVVKDCAGVGPQLMALFSAAMHELVDLNKVLADRQSDAGKAKLKAEQEAAAKLNLPEPKSGEPTPKPPIYPSNHDENIDKRRA